MVLQVMSNQKNFPYVDQQMCVESVSLAKIAQAVKTPFYCYSSAAIEQNYYEYEQAFIEQNALICYAVKANSNVAVLKTLANLGAGMDVVSIGEIKRAIKAGVSPNKIVYSGVAKTKEEIEVALNLNILQFNVESEPELMSISEVATQLNTTAAIALRINPDVEAKTHAKITTGKSENKFGIPISKALAIYKIAASLPGILIQGVDVHIGSQLTDLEPFRETYIKIADLVCKLREEGHNISIIDIGGGLGVDYGDGQSIPSKSDYGQLAKQYLGQLGCRIIVEPGRSMIANAGVLVTSVIYLKKGEDRQFLILDAAMNDFIRPSLYDASHDIFPLNYTRKKKEYYDIVGPVCETGDTFAKKKMLTSCKEGDLLSIMACGAYGAVMSSTYNTRRLIPEVLVKNTLFDVIRERTSYDDLINLDTVPTWC